MCTHSIPNTQYPIAMQWWIHLKLQIQCFHQWARIDQWHRHCSPLHPSDTIWCEKSQDVFRSMWFYFSFTIWLSISDGLGSPWTFTIFVKQWKQLELKIAIYKSIVVWHYPFLVYHSVCGCGCWRGSIFITSNPTHRSVFITVEEEEIKSDRTCFDVEIILRKCLLGEVFLIYGIIYI